MTDLWFEAALLPAGWASSVRVSIRDGRLVAVKPNAPAHPDDERHAVAIPGLCNVHSHGFQRGMAGLAEHRGDNDDDFWSWRALMYRFLDRLDPADIEAITAQAFVEMLETGFTRVGEFHYLHNDPDGRHYTDPAELAGRIVAAAEASGIGLTLLPVFYSHSDFGGAPPTSGQRRFVSDLDGFAALFDASERLLPEDGVLGVAPHSLRAVTPQELAMLTALRPDAPLHIHAAEQVKEVDASVAFSGARPVEWLLDNADVNERWCLVHATHMTEAETDRLAASGAVAGLCPVTEANLGDGVFPAVRYLERGGRFGVGTDSNILIDPAGELRALEYSQRLAHGGRNLLGSGARLFSAALAGGAQALGVDVGIAEGKPADLVTLDPNHPALLGRSGDMLLDSWIFAARSGAVDCVWRGGRRVVSDGRHAAAEAVRQRFAATLAKLLA